MIEAQDGPQAPARASEHAGAIDMVLTDLVMPGMTGQELAERVVAERPDATVIFMTGYSQDRLEDGGMRRDGVPFIQKPFRPIDLTAEVRQLLDAKRTDQRSHPASSAPPRRG